MYAAMWRHLPGPWWVRLFIVLALVAAIVLVCFKLFFPWLSPKLPFNQDTMEPSDQDSGPVPTVIEPTTP
ncbi:MAG: hypothetical protein FWG16_06025 [Micrococcales bacterium]|nr:hypothetical protein [Micrococcales bacterium]